MNCSLSLSFIYRLSILWHSLGENPQTRRTRRKLFPSFCLVVDVMSIIQTTIQLIAGKFSSSFSVSIGRILLVIDSVKSISPFGSVAAVSLSASTASAQSNHVVQVIQWLLPRWRNNEQSLSETNKLAVLTMWLSRHLHLLSSSPISVSHFEMDKLWLRSIRHLVRLAKFYPPTFVYPEPINSTTNVAGGWQKLCIRRDRRNTHLSIAFKYWTLECIGAAIAGNVAEDFQVVAVVRYVEYSIDRVV